MRTTLGLDMSSDPFWEDSPLIFVVDDDKYMLMLLRLALEQQGYQVLEAQNGAACLAAYQYQKPDAILLDAVMPGMAGFACCTELRKFKGSTVPVLMIAVLDEPNSVEQAFTLSARACITKPIHWVVLRHGVRYLLEQFQLSKLVRSSQYQVGASSLLNGWLRGNEFAVNSGGILQNRTFPIGFDTYENTRNGNNLAGLAWTTKEIKMTSDGTP